MEVANKANIVKVRNCFKAQNNLKKKIYKFICLCYYRILTIIIENSEPLENVDKVG